MGINLKDVLSFAEGAIERDKEIGQQNLAMRNEVLQANKKELIEQKKKKYDRELNNFYKEEEKYKTLESAAADYKSGTIDKDTYASMVLPMMNANWDKLPPNIQIERIQNFTGKTPPYELIGSEKEINENAAAEISAINSEVMTALKNSKGDRKLINAILNKKSKSENEVWADVQSKIKATKLAELSTKEIPEELVGIPVGTSSTAQDSNLAWSRFKKTKEGDKWMQRYKTLQDKAKLDVTAAKTFNAFLTIMDINDTVKEQNFKITDLGTEIKGVNASTRAIFETYKYVYNNFYNALDAQTVWNNGQTTIDKINTVLNSDVIFNNVKNVIQDREFVERTLKSQHKNKDFVGIIPFNIVSIDNKAIIPKYNEEGKQIGKESIVLPMQVYNALYKDYLEQKKNKNLTAWNNIQRDIRLNRPEASMFLAYIAKNYKKKAEELKAEIISSDTTDKDWIITTNNNELGVFSKKKDGFKSFDKLKEEGQLENLLKLYPEIEQHPKYIEWLKKQK